jgi:hypothetical protein
MADADSALRSPARPTGLNCVSDALACVLPRTRSRGWHRRRSAAGARRRKPARGSCATTTRAAAGRRTCRPAGLRSFPDRSSCAASHWPTRRDCSCGRSATTRPPRRCALGHAVDHRPCRRPGARLRLPMVARPRRRLCVHGRPLWPTRRHPGQGPRRRGHGAPPGNRRCKHRDALPHAPAWPRRGPIRSGCVQRPHVTGSRQASPPSVAANIHLDPSGPIAAEVIERSIRRNCEIESRWDLTWQGSGR